MALGRTLTTSSIGYDPKTKRVIFILSLIEDADPNTIKSFLRKAWKNLDRYFRMGERLPTPSEILTRENLH